MPNYKSQALALHLSHPIIDAHCDSITAYVAGERDLAKLSEDGHLDLPRLRLGKVRVQFLASFVAPSYQQTQALIRCLELLDGCMRLITANPAELLLFTTSDDIRTAITSDKVAVLLSVEGGEALAGQLYVLRTLYRLGVRSLTLTWNNANELAGGAYKPGPLTAFGHSVVQEMNTLGMLIDVSHLSELAFWDVVKASSQPIIASHSCCRALHDHPRNLSDDQIKALAAGGGVIGINFFADFLTGKEASLADVVRHIEHVCNLVGPKHVGIGSDYDGCASVPEGLDDVTHLPALSEALLARGFSTEDAAGIMGGNFLRVMQEVLG
ncbi:MAG: dipeptidase [Peptococcaceae bacterium]|nr:dipeptidase [Peptococcaceae bacterium]